MAKDPAVLFYTADFLVGTSLMSNEQTGKYIRLLCLQHQSGHLSEDDMLNICETCDKRVFDKFIRDEEGLYYNERMEEEINARKAYSISRSKNRTSKKDNICETHDIHMSNICESYVKHMVNEDEDINDTVIDTDNNVDAEKKPSLDNTRFETFWKAYPKKTGKAAALRSWKKIKVTEKLYQIILSAIEQAKSSDQWKRDNGQFIPFPATWLNQGRWDDEYGGTQKPTQTISGKFGTYI